MPKPIDSPPEIAKAFVPDMKAFFAEDSKIKRDEIAIRQFLILNESRQTTAGRFELPT